MIGFGGIMVGIGWIINAYAGSLAMFYLAWSFQASAAVRFTRPVSAWR